jgi:hypothetical protein
MEYHDVNINFKVNVGVFAKAFNEIVGNDYESFIKKYRKEDGSMNLDKKVMINIIMKSNELIESLSEEEVENLTKEFVEKSLENKNKEGLNYEQECKVIECTRIA